MEKLSVRRAVPQDLDRIMEILDLAKVFMRTNGNAAQWNGAYPERDLMQGEINGGHCFVVCHAAAVVGTFCLIFGDDPTYAVIKDGQWKNDAPYATVHRLASDGSTRGVGHACIEFGYNLLENLRADTHAANIPMQRLLRREGFERCGIITVRDGSPRIAYQKSNPLKNRLQELVSPRFVNECKYRQGHINIINALPGTKILGVHIPDLKAMAAALRKEGHAEAALDYFVGQAGTAARSDAADRLCHEEKLLWGLLVGKLDGTPEEIFEQAATFVPHIANWAECDTFCCNAKWKIDDGKLWDFILPYFSSSHEFEVRFATVMAMTRFLVPRHIERTFRQIARLDYDSISSAYSGMKIRPYYVKMGVAWLLATALAANPEKTRAFVREFGLQSKALPDDVVKLYVRKARESFRTRSTDPF